MKSSSAWTQQMVDTFNARQKRAALSLDPVCGNKITLLFSGQVRGGKNNMGVTRDGRHYPKPEFAKWRSEMIHQITKQLPTGFKTITEPTNVKLTYFAGDKRRRDMPAIIDALFHVLERANIVEDDTFLWVSQSTRGYDKENPRTVISFL